MPLLDVKVGWHSLAEKYNLPERFKHLNHHDLLVDVLREEFEESLGQLRSLIAEPCLE
jgi:hypothetical protein